MTAYVETRNLPLKGRFSRPDVYVAVQVVPEGSPPLRSLRQDSAKKRGIEIVHFGEGYRRHSGPNSMFGKALAEARAYADQINNPQQKATHHETTQEHQTHRR